MKVKLSKLFIQHPASSSACLGFIMALFTTGCMSEVPHQPLSRFGVEQKAESKIANEENKEEDKKVESQLLVHSEFFTDEFKFGETGKISIEQLFEAKALEHTIPEYLEKGDIYFLKIVDQTCVKASLVELENKFSVVSFDLFDAGSCDPEKFGKPHLSILVGDIDGNEKEVEIFFSIEPPIKEDGANRAPVVLQSKIDIQLPAGEVSAIDVKTLLADGKLVEDEDGDALSIESLKNEEMKDKVDVQVSKDGNTIRFDASTLRVKDVYQFQISITDGKDSAEEAITIVVSLIEGKATAEGKDK